MTRELVPGVRASLFGKLPSAFDFVRVHHVHPVAIGFDGWLQSALQQLAQAGAAWPAGRVRFVYAPRAGGAVVAGVLAPSRDRAGRKFPVSVYVVAPATPLVGRMALVPFWLDDFLEDAEQLLDRVGALEREATIEAVRALSAPPASMLVEARGLRDRALASRSARELSRTLHPDASEPERRFLQAHAVLAHTAARFRSRPPERAIVLDAPSGGGDDLALALTLLDGALAWTDAPPSVFWSSDASLSRLLIALGPPPATIPLWLAEPTRRAERRLVLGSDTPSAEDAGLLARVRPALWDLPVGRFATELTRLVLGTAR